MAKVSFTNDPATSAAPVAQAPIEVAATVTPAPAPAPAENSAPAPAPAAEAAPAAPAAGLPAVSAPSGSLAPSGLVLGDKLPDFKDIILPRVNLVQNIGELCKTYRPGTLLFGQSVELFTPPEIDAKTNTIAKPATAPANIIVLGFRPTRYVEKTVGGVRGDIVNSEAEVLAKGATLDYKEWEAKKAAGMKLYQPLADAVVLVEKPAHIADDDTLFVYDVEGKKWALGLWSMKSTSYTNGAKVLFTARAIGALRKGYPTRNLSVSTKEETYGTSNRAWVPVVLPTKESTPAQIEFVKQVLGA